MDALTKDYGGVRGGASMVKAWFSVPECQDVLCTVPGAIIPASGNCTVGVANPIDLQVEQYCLPLLVAEV
jgi:hypothetical protein